MPNYREHVRLGIRLAAAATVALSMLTPAMAQTATPASTAPDSAAPTANTETDSTAQTPFGAPANVAANREATTAPTSSANPPEPTAPPADAGQLVHGSVPAPTAAMRHYDMAMTIALALQTSADLANAERLVQIDRKRSDEAKAAGRPNLSATGSATRFDAPTKLSFGGGPPVTLIGDHTETLAMNLSDRLDLSGQIRAASSQAQLQSLADEMAARQIRNQRILRARTVYYDLLRAQHQVSVSDEALLTAQAQQTIAFNLNQQQVGQKIDVLRANTQVATAQQDATRARNRLGIARHNYNNLIGQPLDAPVTVDDVAGVTVGQPIASASHVGEASSDTPLFAAPRPELDAIQIDQSQATADANRPEVLAARIGVREAQTGIKIAHQGLDPTLSLSATGDYYPTLSFQTPRKRTAALTATLVVPLWDGGATRDRVDEARLQKDNAQTTLDSRKSDVALDVGQAYLNLMTAASQIDAANAALQQAVATRQLAEIRYEGQVGIYLEVTDAQSALVSAENNQVNSVYDYLVARAQFDNALGVPGTK